jgi:hypothetical protein
MPKTAPENEFINQASDSLRAILCKRSEPDCKPDPRNTVIITTYQYKTFHFFLGFNEPCITAFYDHKPFGVYGMSIKPSWLNERQTYPDQNTTEMVYVTSINWKEKGRRDGTKNICMMKSLSNLASTTRGRLLLIFWPAICGSI